MIDPKCPDCKNQLPPSTYDRQRPSFPIQQFFECNHCEFKGWVSLDLDEEEKQWIRKWEENGYKIEIGEPVILNDEWIKNLKNFNS